MRVILFSFYYAKLRLKLLLGIHKTASPVALKWRWENWNYNYHSRRRRR